jgi:hypothetical protein
MSNIPVDRMISILEIIHAHNSQTSHTGMNKNQICRATGIKNKGPTLAAIELLTKDKILDSKKVNKQKELLTLTPLGHGIIDLITDINVANEAYTALEIKISEYESLIESANIAAEEDAQEDEDEEYDKILRRKLLQKGWKDEELESFHNVIESTCRIENSYRKNICNSLLHRYSLISSKFEVKENTREILTKIILKQITHLLSLDPHPSNSVFPPSELPVYRFEDLGSPIADEIESEFHLDYFSKSRLILLNRFVSNEALKLMTSLLSIIKLRGGDLRIRMIETGIDLKYLREAIQDNESKNDADSIKEIELDILALEQLEQIYNNYKARYQTYVKETDDEDRKSVNEILTSALGPNWAENPDYV